MSQDPRASLAASAWLVAVAVAVAGCSSEPSPAQGVGAAGASGPSVPAAGANPGPSAGSGAVPGSARPAVGGSLAAPVDAGGGDSGAAGAPDAGGVAGRASAGTAGAGGAAAGAGGSDGTMPAAGASGSPAADGGEDMVTGSCPTGDALGALRTYAPADEDLASDFESYLTEELGTVTCATEGTGSARTITEPIFVPANTTYDGKGEKLTADAAAMNCDTSEGEQAESQRPFFVLAPGAQLKNVTFTYPGCEGVHMLGDNVLENLVWEDAGEDAASVRSYFPGGKILIKNSKGHKAADKMFQFNAPCEVRIEQFEGSDMGKLVRQNGGTEFRLTVDLNTVNITGVISAVVQSDSPMCFVRHHALTYQFTGSGDKSDRVFRDIPPANVMEY